MLKSNGIDEKLLIFCICETMNKLDVLAKMKYDSCMIIVQYTF